MQAPGANVERTPGAGEIDLSHATIHYDSPLGAAELTGVSRTGSGDPNFEGHALSGNAPTLPNPEDVTRARIQLSDTSDTMHVLEPGDSATLDILSADGARTAVAVNIPDSLDRENAVTP